MRVPSNACDIHPAALKFESPEPMELIDNISQLLGDDLKKTLVSRAKFKVAASCFSIYAFEALKAELERVESLEFIFTKPTFVPNEATDPVRKERREFHIPKAERERSFYGTEFEIQLKNKLTQRAIAKECADWMRRKARFRSNRGKAPMQQFACVNSETANMKDVYYKPDVLKKGDLFDQVENIKEDRTPEDLLFQVLLDWGVDLSLPIAQETIDGKTVFFVDQNALAACFDKGVSEELVKKVASRKPLRVVFRDAGFGSDAVKINVEQIFKLVSPGTEVKAI